MPDSTSEPIAAGLPRSVSNVSRSAVLRHPSPAGSSTHAGNISRLERSAEEMSQGGADIAEEIRKIRREISSRSASSIQSGSHSDLHAREPRRVGSARSRTSSSAHQHSIADLDGGARWGGYSPGALVTSPTSSVRSRGPWTKTSINRVASSRQSSRPTMVEPLQEGRPLDSPLAPSSASFYSQDQHVSRQASQTSFSRRYDAMAQQIEESLQTIPPSASPRNDPGQQDGHRYQEQDTPDRPYSTDTFQEAQIAFKDFDGVHFDPDREEYVELDQEGHEVRRVSARSSSGTLMGAASLLRTARADRPISYGAPPPSENMVYYPAPVPRMLNLPKRISQQQPPSHAQAKRRTRMLDELSAGARQSAPWIPPMTFSEDGHPSQEEQRVPTETRSYRSGSASTNNPDAPRGMLNQRMSMANAHNLPAHLRASMFFEHQSIPHDVEVKSESAVATLDSILAASATAPVSAFTDHPYAGDVRKTVYAPERTHQRRSTATTLATAASDKEKGKQVKKRRSSSIGKLFRRKSTDRLDEDLDQGKQSRPVSRGSLLAFNEGGNTLQKRRSQLSLGGELDRTDDSGHTAGQETTERERRRQTGLGLGLVDQALNASPKKEEAANRSRPVTAMSMPLTDVDQIEADFKEQEEQEYNDIDDDPVFAQPTTLLAELQVRKAQLKSRNRTAATAFPGGMHSTLLQLDAVEQINARKRQKQRVQLAWEDPHLRAEEDALQNDVDEDVPLGVLFPAKDGTVNRTLGDSRDWNRPLGLMARRELEDNEPLSSRRNRLNPNARLSKKDLSQDHLTGQPGIPSQQQEEDGDEDETLGQRLRRLKTRDALDDAISDMAPKNGERPISTFAASVLDEFPELNLHDKQNQERPASAESQKGAQATPGTGEEETLGQRRARLQRDREAAGETAAADGGAVRPPLHTSNSLSNLLSANPVGQRGIVGKNQQAAPGTLLHSANQQLLKHRQDLLTANTRSASFNALEQPLIDARPHTSGDPRTGLLASGRSRPANGAYSGNAAAVVDPLGSSRVNFTNGLLGASQSRPANGAFAEGVYNTAAAGGGMGMQNPMMGMRASNAYFASPTAGMAYGGYAGDHMMGYQMSRQSMVNPSAYYGMHGGSPAPMMPSQSTFHPMAGMSAMGPGTYGYSAQQQMGVGVDQASLDPNQRAAIDRWRMGVAQ